MINIYRMRPHWTNARRRNAERYFCRMFPAIQIFASTIVGLSLMILPCSTIFAEETSPESEQGRTVASNESVRNYADITFKSSNRRDPFLNPLLRSKQSEGDREIDRGVAPPGIAGTFIAEAELKGISIRESGRLAIVKGNGNRAYFLREGDRLFDGYLKTIYRDSITLVRETRMRSGKVETQEVTKKLRTP